MTTAAIIPVQRRSRERRALPKTKHSSVAPTLLPDSVTEDVRRALVSLMKEALKQPGFTLSSCFEHFGGGAIKSSTFRVGLAELNIICSEESATKLVETYGRDGEIDLTGFRRLLMSRGNSKRERGLVVQQGHQSLTSSSYEREPLLSKILRRLEHVEELLGSQPRTKGVDREELVNGVFLSPLTFELEKKGDWKGFLSYVAFFTCFICLSVLRVDWMYGHQTYLIFQSSSPGVDVTDEFVSLKTADETACWLGGHCETECTEGSRCNLPMRINALQRTCPDCKVGIAREASAMTLLTLKDFVCSDFDSKRGTTDYPDRQNCSAIDEEWATWPTPETAPCCTNSTLVRASVAMMALYAHDGTPHATMDVLEKEMIVDAQLFVKSQIESNQHLVQLIISREQRMIGVNFFIDWLDEENRWTPGTVKNDIKFWSYHYGAKALKRAWKVAMYLLGAFGVTHEVFEVYVIWPLKYERRLFLILVEIPTFVLPVLATDFRENLGLEVSDEILLISFSFMFMLIRLYEEGKCIPAFVVLLDSITRSAAMVVKLLCALIPIVVLFILMHGMLFGVFNDSYGSTMAAFVMVTQSSFVTGPEFDETSAKYHMTGAIVMFLCTTFVLFLTLSQFFIAVLVGAWDTTVEEHKEEKKRKALPEGFVLAGATPPAYVRVKDWMAYFWFWYLPSYEAYGPKLLVAINSCKAKDADHDRHVSVCSSSELRTALAEYGLSENTADAIERRYRCIVPASTIAKLDFEGDEKGFEAAVPHSGSFVRRAEAG